MSVQPSRRVFLSLAAGALGASWSPVFGRQDPPKQDPAFAGPPPVPVVPLGPTLKTHPIRRTGSGFVNQENRKAVFNERWVDAAVLPRDKKGIWVLDFAYKPLRIMTIEDEKGRRDVHYLYYQVINRTGEPRMFVPQFTLVTDTGKRYDDTVLPKAVKNISNREDPTISYLHGAVAIMGMVPPSTKQAIDDAVFGVAIWDGVDPKADKMTIFVRGLSDGYRNDPAPAGGNSVEQAANGGKPTVRYKALQINFVRRGDEHNLNEREITPGEPPFDWTYY